MHLAGESLVRTASFYRSSGPNRMDEWQFLLQEEVRAVIFVIRRGKNGNFCYKKMCLSPDVAQKCPGLVLIWS